MNKQIAHSKEMIVTKNSSKVLHCSTPEHRVDSPTRDSDSEAASPVPFLCTQDGAEGETDVVWNFYTPKADHGAHSRSKSSTPLSRRSKKSVRPRLIEKQVPRRRPLKISQRKTELFKDLIELNQNIHEIIAQKPQSDSLKQQVGSDEDIFSNSPEYSPKSARRNSSRCLRKNVLSSNFNKPDSETALESDDSMNECLLKASQIVEDNILSSEPVAKRSCYESNAKKNLKTELNFKMDNDSMDSILNSIKLEMPAVSRAKKCDSPGLKDDSFDSFVINLNDSALEQLTQMPVKIDTSSKKCAGDWTIKELVVHDGSPLNKSIFGRHNSMPESPSMGQTNKPSTSGMVFGRYNSMPFGNNQDSTELGDSPIRCTQDEIKKKHQLARERLLAKRLFPYSSSSQNSSQCPEHKNVQPTVVPKKTHFQPKVPSSSNLKVNKLPSEVSIQNQLKPATNSMDLKQLIEKKRQEALMKLRRRQPKH